jgi:hypothetical protein
MLSALSLKKGAVGEEKNQKEIEKVGNASLSHCQCSINGSSLRWLHRPPFW